MTTYSAIPHTVTAVRYTRVGDITAIEAMWPDHAAVEQCRLPGPGRGMSPGIRITTGRWGVIPVREGEWVLRHADGSHEVLSHRQFCRRYQPAMAGWQSK